MEESITIEKKQSLLSPQIRRRRVKFNISRMRTQPTTLTTAQLMKSKKNEGKKFVKKRCLENSYSENIFQQKQQQKEIIKQESLNIYLNKLKESNSSCLMQKITLRKTNRLNLNLRECKDNCKGYEKRKLRLGHEINDLRSFLGNTSNYGGKTQKQNRLSGLQYVVDKMGSALMQKVPKIRKMSEQCDGYLAYNKANLYWGFQE